MPQERATYKHLSGSPWGLLSPALSSSASRACAPAVARSFAGPLLAGRGWGDRAELSAPRTGPGSARGSETRATPRELPGDTRATPRVPTTGVEQPVGRAGPCPELRKGPQSGAGRQWGSPRQEPPTPAGRAGVAAPGSRAKFLSGETAGGGGGGCSGTARGRPRLPAASSPRPRGGRGRRAASGTSPGAGARGGVFPRVVQQRPPVRAEREAGTGAAPGPAPSHPSRGGRTGNTSLPLGRRTAAKQLRAERRRSRGARAGARLGGALRPGRPQPRRGRAERARGAARAAGTRRAPLRTAPRRAPRARGRQGRNFPEARRDGRRRRLRLLPRAGRGRLSRAPAPGPAPPRPPARREPGVPVPAPSLAPTSPRSGPAPAPAEKFAGSRGPARPRQGQTGRAALPSPPAGGGSGAGLRGLLLGKGKVCCWVTNKGRKEEARRGEAGVGGEQGSLTFLAAQLLLCKPFCPRLRAHAHAALSYSPCSTRSPFFGLSKVHPSLSLSLFPFPQELGLAALLSWPAGGISSFPRPPSPLFLLPSRH